MRWIMAKKKGIPSRSVDFQRCNLGKKIATHLFTQSAFRIPLFQRALRLADAKAVEAKAARIKDWVTNKLRELEDQNHHLKAQNAKATEQMELLRNRLEQLQELGGSGGGSTTKARQESIAEVRIHFPEKKSFCFPPPPPILCLCNATMTNVCAKAHCTMWSLSADLFFL